MNCLTMVALGVSITCFVGGSPGGGVVWLVVAYMLSD